MLDGNIDVLELEGQIAEYVSLEGELLPIGPKGDKGDDGISPIISVSKTGKRTTLTINDAEGTKYAYIDDGIDATAGGDMLRSVYDKNNSGVVDNAEKVNGKTVEANVPANAKFTDTLYDDTEIRSLINAKPDFTDIPTNVSELENDANYVSSNGDSTVSGENTALTLNKTTKGLFKVFDLKGNTSQKTLSGRNLFDKNSGFDKGYYSITGSWVSEDVTACLGFTPVKANTAYTYSTNVITQNKNVMYFDSTKTFIGRNTVNDNVKDITFTTPSNTSYVRLTFAAMGRPVITQELIDSLDVQLEEGSTATSYEPYCGGIPSPNPNYPQDVNTVSGDNEIVVCGKNLFPSNQVPQTINGITLTKNNDGTYNLRGTATAQTIFRTNELLANILLTNGETYTYSSSKQLPSGLTTRLETYDGTTWKKDITGKLTNATQYRTVVFNDNDSNILRQSIFIENGITINVNNLGLMLEKGATATTYEPYTDKSYLINLPVENKYENPTVIPITTDSSYSASTNRIDDKSFSITCIKQNSDNKSWFSEIELDISKFKPNTTYTLSKKHISIGTQFTNQGALRTKINGAYGDTKNADSITFTTPSTLTSLAVLFYGAYNTTMSGESTITFTDIQLEEGSKVNSFTPYGTTPIELNKIGTYQDYFYKENGKWYLHKETNKLVIDGSEGYDFSVDVNYYQNRNRYIVEKIDTEYSSAAPMISAVYNLASPSPGTDYSRYDNVILMRWLNTNQKTRLDMMSSTLGISNVSDFKAWLANNNLVCYYVLPTPTNTEITDTSLISQLNAIEKAISYNNQTNINQTNNDLPFILNVEAFTDTYNGRYENIQNMSLKALEVE